ncbi:helix-turn-helix domain-containing protein [Alicyclobacillus curvatus]|jgi:XRE family transcriptional regulator, master regulator for biofilm formation|nr:helix-turn-helix domain-containing protein [Alicyclobacillus curvatus]
MIGKRIQQLRLQRRMSLSELAERAGVAKSYLSAIERDIQGNPSISVLEKLCGVLGVSMTALIEGDDAELQKQLERLDQDWINLIRDAMTSGVSKGEFKDFLEFQKWRSKREGTDTTE